MDGIIILIAGAVLMTPGVRTDAFGFFCLIPPCRELLKRYLRARFERAVRRGDVTVPVPPRTVRDVTLKGAAPTEDAAVGRIGGS